VDDPGEVARGRELLQTALEQYGVRAQVHVHLALDEFLNHLGDLGGVAAAHAGDGHHWRSGVFDGLDDVVHRKSFSEYLSWVLNLAATRTREIAREERSISIMNG